MQYGYVFYTDGSARPNPGYAGWGIHGYYYKDVVKARGTGLKKPKLKITKYGYRLLNETILLPKRHTVQISTEQYVEPIEYYDSYGVCEYPATNNAAELTAVLEVFKIVYNNLEYKYDLVYILSDSQYVVDGIHAVLHDKNNHITKDKPNYDLWMMCSDILKELDKDKIIIAYIPGHKDHLGNEIADDLANMATLAYRSNPNLFNNEENQSYLHVHSHKGYWKPTLDRHPYIYLKKLFYTTNDDLDKSIYFSYGYDTDVETHEYGKKSPHAVYSIAITDKPIDIIDNIQSKLNTLTDRKEIGVVYLNKLYNVNTYRFVQRFKHSTYAVDKNTHKAIYCLKEPLAFILKNTALALRAITQSELLYDRLNQYLEKDPDITIVDITSKFYVTSRNKTRFIKDIKQNDLILIEDTLNHKSISTDYKINLLFSMDLPPRNTLKQLENYEPKIYLIFWNESPNVIGYATVVDSTQGVLIQRNIYTNLIFINQKGDIQS